MKASIIRLLTFLLFLTSMALNLSQATAQGVQVASRVVDSNTRTPVAYASIGLLGSNRGTVTDEEGNFSLLLPPKDSPILKVSALGYASLTLEAIQVEDTIYLHPAAFSLQEVVVQAASVEPREIVKRAFEAISRNYHREPVLLETFYRHYCQDDSLYGRIIEATVDIYKKRGYGKRENYTNNKDLVRVKELRRSLDNTRFTKTAHAPMALELVQQNDLAALREKASSDNKELSLLLDNQNFVNPKDKSFDFELHGITTLDDEEVYEVHFRFKKREDTNGQSEVAYEGRFFITTKNYVILRFESKSGEAKAQFSQSVSYRKFGDKYTLSHSLYESWSISRDNKQHRVHVELVVTNLFKGRQKGFDRSEIDREYLATIPYRHKFWESYPLIRFNPVPERVAQDLQAAVSLDEQYEDVQQYEAKFTNETKQDEQALLKRISENKGILVVDLWAAWCAPCIQEYKVSEANRKAFMEKGVQFLMVSVDADLKRWRNTIELFEMTQESHLKIGPDARFLRPLKMEGVPRYLVYQGQKLVNDKAPRPSTQAFRVLMERLLVENLN